MGAHELAVELGPLAGEQRAEGLRGLPDVRRRAPPGPPVPALDDDRARRADREMHRAAADRGDRRDTHRERHRVTDADRERPDRERDPLRPGRDRGRQREGVEGRHLTDPELG